MRDRRINVDAIDVASGHVLYGSVHLRTPWRIGDGPRVRVVVRVCARGARAWLPHDTSGCMPETFVVRGHAIDHGVQERAISGRSACDEMRGLIACHEANRPHDLADIVLRTVANTSCAVVCRAVLAMDRLCLHHATRSQITRTLSWTSWISSMRLAQATRRLRTLEPTGPATIPRSHTRT